MSGEPFHRCTHTALSPRGDLYVSDGYGNARVHKFAPERPAAPLVGRAGHRSGPVQHPAQHLLRRRRLGLRGRPREPPHPGLRRRRALRDPVARHAPALGAAPRARRRGALLRGRDRRRRCRSTTTCPTSGRASAIYSHRGERLARLGDRLAGLEPGQFVSPHGLAVDSRGDIYVGEVSFTNWGNRYKGQPLPPGLRSLQKLVKAR